MIIASGRAASDSFGGRAPGRALLWPGSSSATSSPSGGAVGSRPLLLFLRFLLRCALSRLWRRLLGSRGEDPDLLDSDQPLVRFLLPGGLTDRDCLELL